MERRRKRSLGKKPLPGDRQGVSGADAGHDSIRTIGNDLSRRDIVGEPENMTADTPEIRGPHRENTNPAMDVLQEQPAITKAGKQRQRIQWTDEMNRTVMSCYYTATKLETISSGYRSEVYELFIARYPQLETRVTEQRLIDQKRVIMKNNRLTAQELQIIQQKVANELDRNQTIQQQRQNIIRDSIGATENEPIGQTQHTETDTLQQDTIVHSQTTSENDINTQEFVRDETLAMLETNITIWIGSDPTKRNILPRLIYKKGTQKIIDIINNSLPERYITKDTTLQDIHAIIYAAAITTIQCNKQRVLKIIKNININRRTKPNWQIRLEQKIGKIRKDIGRLTQAMKGNTSKTVAKYVNKLIHNNNNNATLQETLDTQKQKLAVYAARLKRYNKSNRRKEDNKLFKTNEKQFYQKLSQEQTTNIIPPTKEQIIEFWTQTWSNQTQHNKKAIWISEEEQKHEHVIEQPEYAITEQELSQTIQNTHNWKCPGIDHIHNFWYKKFTKTHQYLAQQINKTIENPSIFPLFLTQGITYIKPKNQDTQNPANYRPITCLPTLYKIITSTISKKIEKHLTQYHLLSEEQKGCRRNSQGCKEQLIIDSIIMKQTTKQKRNLHTCYIDYKKAFDTVPHTWLQRILQIYKVNTQIQSFLNAIMQTWRTKIHLRTPTNTIQTDEIKIRKGIFQGDSLSALWFCMCINPLSNLLNDTKYGFDIRSHKQKKYTISHLMYMDDIKIYAATKTQLDGLLKVTEAFTKDINMEFGITKCKTLHVEKGKWSEDEMQRTLQNEILDNMDKHETYKYLGFQQNTRIDHTDIKQNLQQRYKTRLTTLLKTELNSKNLFKAINTYAIPLLTYSFGIIKWTSTDLENINILTRAQLTKAQTHHPKACKERLTISRREGGRGLTDISSLHTRQIQTLRQYFQKKENKLHKAINQADRNYTPLNLAAQNHETDTYSKNEHTKRKIETWSQKQLHGKHRYIMSNEHINTTDTYTWLQQGKLFPETEGFIIAIQDQVIATRNYLKHIIKDPNIQDDKCRKCKQFPETIDHITGGCKLLASMEYTERHNTVAKIIHKAIINTYNIEQNNTPYYKYTPTTVIENENYKLYWDITIHTDKTMKFNRPDITFAKKKEKVTYLIDISIPNDTNIEHKHNEKIEKYTPLAQEIQRIWKQQKVYIIPMIMSVTGITPNTFKKYLTQLKIPLHTHEEAQKATILKTCNITRSFLNTG